MVHYHSLIFVALPCLEKIDLRASITAFVVNEDNFTISGHRVK